MKSEEVRQERRIFLAARLLSVLFTPFWLPIAGLVVLFLFSYLSIFPWYYKLQVLILVYLFTILLPTVMIRFYRRYHGWTLIELGHRERRMVPYVISILCYFACVYVMNRLHMPHFMGSLFAYAEFLAFNPVWWLCLVFLVGGLLGTCRMLLRQHSLGQVVGGFWIGFLCAAFAIFFL